MPIFFEEISPKLPNPLQNREFWWRLGGGSLKNTLNYGYEILNAFNFASSSQLAQRKAEKVTSYLSRSKFGTMGVVGLASDGWYACLRYDVQICNFKYYYWCALFTPFWLWHFSPLFLLFHDVLWLFRLEFSLHSLNRCREQLRRRQSV